MTDGPSKGYFGGMSMTGDQIRSLQPALVALLKRFKHCFKRKESLHHCEEFILGLMMDLKRKSVEPIALARGVAVRTLQEFLAFFAWDHDRAGQTLQLIVADEYACDEAIGVIDASAHVKSGDKTPGVQRQYCGERGKIENCVVGQHLLYTDNDAENPFCCVLASDLFLPEAWSEDRRRCREAGIPDEMVHRPKWQIAVEQLEQVIGNGVTLTWVTFDEDYGRIPEFWFELDRLGQAAIGEVPPHFHCWPQRPWYRSLNPAHASKRVDNVCRYSPVFTKKRWTRLTIKDATRGPVVWQVRAARVHLVRTRKPTDRKYWLIVAWNTDTGEVKYFVSNAPARTALKDLMRVAFSRWHIEKWFERAKQETGFGDFEVRTYTSLIRHWLCSRMAMFFLASETKRLRGEKSADHLGAGGEGGSCVDVECLVPEGLAGQPVFPVQLLSASQRGLVSQSPQDGAPARAL
jgi:SRSO17 transposase